MPKAFLFFLRLHGFGAIFIVGLNTAGGNCGIGADTDTVYTETAITSRVDAGLEGVLPGNSSDMLICRLRNATGVIVYFLRVIFSHPEPAV